VQAPFVETIADSVSVSLDVFAVVPEDSASQGLDFSSEVLLATHSHAPPVSQTAVNAPLRI
jgi:hypothetical protein